MLNNVMSMTIILFVVSVFILILASVGIVILLKMRKQMNDWFGSIAFSIYELRKNQTDSLEKFDTFDTEIKKALTIINKNIGSLSSGNDQLEKKLDEVIQSKNLLNKYRMPSPDESKRMRETIMENLNTEVLLSQNLKIARKDSVRNIIDNTLATYPDIEPEYTIKLCLAMVENFIEVEQ